MKTLNSYLVVMILTGFVLSQSAEAQDRKRWSPQAKDATIGGVAGGAAGAIINKRNRVVGGLIGGVVGGAAGYAIGKNKDNKNKAAARLAAAQAETARERERADAAERDRVAALAAATPPHGFGVARPAQVTVARKPVAAPAQATPAAPAPAAIASSSYVLNEAFLPNPSYGDPETPYASSQYRRKSW
ncbi:glycine zipper domain-containing protein [Spirosoma jeollabukense]